MPQATLETTKPIMSQFDILDPTGVNYGETVLFTWSFEINLTNKHINM
jgi:hypothetical protein